MLSAGTARTVGHRLITECYNSLHSESDGIGKVVHRAEKETQSALAQSCSSLLSCDKVVKAVQHLAPP